MLRLVFALLLSATVCTQDPLVWDDLPPLPDTIGFGGPACGVDGDTLIVAGGANFPAAPPWEGGAKVWHADVFVLTEPDGAWQRVGPLRHRLAYAAVTSTPDGLAIVGGDDGKRCFAEAFLLRFRDGSMIRETLPRPAARDDVRQRVLHRVGDLRRDRTGTTRRPDVAPPRLLSPRSDRGPPRMAGAAAVARRSTAEDDARRPERR